MEEDMEWLRERMGKLREMMAEARISGVGGLMKEDVVTVRRFNSILDVAETMKEHDVSCVVVVEGKQPVGIVTEKDLVRRVIAEKMDPYSSVEKVMSAPLITVSKDTDIGVATKIMIERKIRRLPVVEGGSLVGIITARDVLNITPKALEVRNFEDILKDI
jgi:CBS domain-containing protein